MTIGQYRFCGGRLLRRLAALALALLLTAGVSLSAAEESSAVDVDLIMAQNAIAAYGVHDAEGRLMTPRKAPEMPGRGEPDAAGEEPDYRGVVGYMSLQTSWDVSRFNTFTQTPWLLPVYEQDGDSWKVSSDAIKHKTPVLVVDQQLREGKGHKFVGYLKVVRLDIHRMVWIDVTQFVTMPYWTLELSEAVQYGYCIAVYRDNSRYEPMDRKGHRGTLPNGLRILMCDKKTSRYFSPDRENNPLLGIVFRSKKASESYFRTFLFFSLDDLTLVY